MSDSQRLIPWLTLVLLTVVGVAGAAIGIQQAPSNAGLTVAVDNTLKAPNYTSLLQATAPQPQTQLLVWQAPDKLSGYVDTQGKRFYVRVVGSEEYQSSVVATSTGPGNLTFTKGALSQPASAYDPVQGYLPYAKRATHVTQNGDQYSFVITQDGQTAHFVFTVTGQYVSHVQLTAASTRVDLTISDVGTSPSVTLPSKVTTAAPSTSTGGTAG